MARGFHSAPGASPEVQAVLRPDMPHDELPEHARSRNPLVRQLVAERPDCPLGLLITLAYDSTAEVRAAVAANPATSPALLEHLAHDHHAAVAIAVATNPSARADALGLLTVHRKAEVRAVVQQRLGEVASSVEDAHVPELRDYAADPQPVAVEAPLIPELEPDPIPVAVPAAVQTRTAPVRGFRPPAARTT